VAEGGGLLNQKIELLKNARNLNKINNIKGLCVLFFPATRHIKTSF
jgi:hypothetical protein